MSTVAEELVGLLDRLSAEDQEHVLDYARDLARPRQGTLITPRTPLPPGTPMRDLARFSGTLPAELADEMARIIEEGCERIDPDEHPFE
ncbi:MAG TPA: hypothetical protein VF116_08905 [Ktedonobacterales bacterium]